MKYIILIVGGLIIGWIAGRNELFDDTGGYGSGVGCIAVMMLGLLWLVVWLIVFFVFDVQLPKITI